jgi:hypothetical protein
MPSRFGGESSRSGPSGHSLRRGVRRASYPSGAWLDEDGRLAKSPNEDYQVASKPNSLMPDPSNYKIVQAKQVGNYLVLKIKYPNCTNHEGNKILVFKDLTPIDLLNQKLIDPHFFEERGFKSPIARFVPTKEGWDMALAFSSMMNKGKL